MNIFFFTVKYLSHTIILILMALLITKWNINKDFFLRKTSNKRWKEGKAEANTRSA